MVQFAIIVFLVIPLVISALMLVCLLCKYSSLFAVSRESIQPEPSLTDHSQQGLSRMQLNHIVGQVRRIDRRRRCSSRSIYFFA